jgi:hypothetical protein
VDAVLIFDTDVRDADARPVRTIRGSQTGLRQPFDVAVDSAGMLYVANLASDAVTVYAPNADGDARPIRTIAGPRTKLHEPFSVAVDASGAVYVVDRRFCRVLVFAAGADGDVAPSRIVWGSLAELLFPTAVAVDRAGTMFVVVAGKGVVVHAPGANGNAIPIRRLGVAWTSPQAGLDLFRGARDVTIGRGDTLFVTAPDTVAVFAPGVDGTPRPLRQIWGPRTGLASPLALGVDARGVFYAFNGRRGASSVTGFGADADGDAAPAVTLAGPHTDLDTPPPSRIALEAAAARRRREARSSVTVYAPRAAGDARPIRTIAGPHTGFGSLFGIAVGKTGEIYALSCDGAIAVHARGANGDARPDRMRTGRVQGVNAVTSFDLALGPSDSVFVASTTGWGGGRGYLTVYGPGLGPPAERPRLSARWRSTASLAVDARGAVYVGTSWGEVHGYAPGAPEIAPPFASLDGPSTELFLVTDVALDPRDAAIYTVNGDDAVRVYAPIVEGAPADRPPIRVLSGARTGLESPIAIALDTMGTLYVLNAGARGDGSITVYAPGALGDAAPLRTITGPRTGLARPRALAVDARGFLYVANAPNDEMCYGTAVY